MRTTATHPEASILDTGKINLLARRSALSAIERSAVLHGPFTGGLDVAVGVVVTSDASGGPEVRVLSVGAGDGHSTLAQMLDAASDALVERAEHAHMEHPDFWGFGPTTTAARSSAA